MHLCYTTGVPTRIQTLCHARLEHMDQEEVWIAFSVQQDHTAPQLTFQLTFLVLMERTQTQRDKLHVSSVQKDSSAQILLPLQ